MQYSGLGSNSEDQKTNPDLSPFMKETEIEVQAQIENVKLLASFLEKEGKFQSEKHQVDEYFTPAHRDFLASQPISEWLRLRNSDESYSINYKNWHYDSEGRGLYADEFETKVENLETMQKVFTNLDIKSVIIVDKTRKVYLYKDYEIALDSVKGLGDFVEIEYMGPRSHTEHEKILQEMIQFLRDLNCGKIEVNHSGYPALLLGRGERVDTF